MPDPRIRPRGRVRPPLLLALAWLVGLACGTAASAEHPGASAQHAGASAQHLAPSDSLAIASHARAITARAASDSARAAAIYEWVARNVAYDAAAAVAGATSHETPDAVWRHRLATCGGFVALYARMAQEIGLRVEPIEGYAKGFDYRYGQSTRRPNHAWLAVRIDGRWRLVDPTWGAGHVSGGVFEPAFTWAWFLVDPEALILSHLPESARWQLVARRLSRRDFERMPAVPRSLLDVGFTPGELRATALARGNPGFPLVAANAGARVVRAPATGTLQPAQAVDVELVWPGATEVALVTGDVWTPLARDGTTFRGRAGALPGPVWVIGRSGGEEYVTLLHYRVEPAR